MRAAPLLAACLTLAGCAAPGDAGCEPLVLDLKATEARVGEAIEMDAVLANCTGETQTWAVGCLYPTPTVEVGGRAYFIRDGAATDAVPPCVTSSFAGMSPLRPGEKRAWRADWNGTVASGCSDGDGCGEPLPAPGRHVLRVEFGGMKVEGSVAFR